MANNRMYLRCRKCGSAVFLGKTYMDGYYTDDGYYWRGRKKDSFLEAFNRFCEEHAYCDSEPSKEYNFLEPKFVTPKDGIHPENQFEIAYEFYHED